MAPPLLVPPAAARALHVAGDISSTNCNFFVTGAMPKLAPPLLVPPAAALPPHAPFMLPGDMSELYPPATIDQYGRLVTPVIGPGGELLFQPHVLGMHPGHFFPAFRPFRSAQL